MKRFYDLKVDILYVELSEARTLESEEVQPGPITDFDSAGRIVGMEIHAARTRVAPDALFDTRAAE